MLAATLRRHVGHGAFENLQQRLLNALAADVAGDGGVFVLLGNFVDLINIYDALLGLLDVTVRSLQKRQTNVFDVLADIASLGQSGGVNNGELHIEHSRKS